MTADTSEVDLLRRQLEQKIVHLDLMTSLALVATEPGGVGHLIRRSLEIISRANNWAIGQFWVARESENVLTCSPYYYSSAVLTEFRNASADRRLSKGVGLPGRAWYTALPLLLDLEAQVGMQFTRRTSAINCGLKYGYAFAIKNGPFVTGVLEFFSFQQMELDDVDNMFYEKLGIYVATLIAQREAELAFRQQEAFARIVINHAYNAFIAMNEAGVITEWSAKASLLFGWEREETIGKPLQEVIIPERYRDAHLRGLFRYLTSGEGPVIDKRTKAPALHRDGHELEVELHIFPIEGLGVRRFGAFLVDCSKKDSSPDITLT